jgi:hypothetical protein
MDSFACALVNGDVMCWGGGGDGEIGDGASMDRPSPVPVAW